MKHPNGGIKRTGEAARQPNGAAILSRMKTSPPVPVSLRSCMRLAARHLLAWTVVCAIGAAGSYADQASIAQPRAYDAILQSWLMMHVPVMWLSIAVSIALAWRPRWLGRARVLLTGYIFMLVLFMPVALLYMAWRDVSAVSGEATLQASWHGLLSMPRFDWFLELAWASGTCIAVVALRAWQQSRQHEGDLQRSSREVLQLQLALEQQRLEALRGQLEPHFLFNALNAITALIRDADKSNALAGIAQLSELLRYALAAGTRDWVSLQEEMQFVERYLALQRLRYGARLQVRIEGLDDASRMCELPVLLLQPLVENALRHDIDRHHGPSAITVRCVRHGEQLVIEVTNPAGYDRAPNPGLGLGLSNTEKRLRLLYGKAASLHVEADDEWFCVRVRVPMRAPESVVPMRAPESLVLA